MDKETEKTLSDLGIEESDIIGYMDFGGDEARDEQ